MSAQTDFKRRAEPSNDDGARMDRLITRWGAIGIVVVLVLVAMGVL